MACQAQAEALIADQAKIITDQKNTIEELKEALRLAQAQKEIPMEGLGSFYLTISLEKVTG